mmetsp:Transcript_26590/g.78251  ORF Transcript_26590/g.78251 Transcript_26590/m.78251 type:complete len:211 (+) Transcript_26590:2054-2686(+)
MEAGALVAVLGAHARKQARLAVGMVAVEAQRLEVRDASRCCHVRDGQVLAEVPHSLLELRDPLRRDANKAGKGATHPAEKLAAFRAVHPHLAHELREYQVIYIGLRLPLAPGDLEHLAQRLVEQEHLVPRGRVGGRKDAVPGGFPRQGAHAERSAGEVKASTVAGCTEDVIFVGQLRGRWRCGHHTVQGAHGFAQARVRRRIRTRPVEGF